MKSDLNNIEKESDSQMILDLFGEATDYVKVLTDSCIDDNDLIVKEGEYIEKYFNAKLKYLLKADDAFSNTIDVPQVLDEIILSINYALMNNRRLKERIAKLIIKKVKKLLKSEAVIQIDSFLPGVNGKNINIFFDSIKQYSFPSTHKIDENKKYSLIVESTFCLSSQIYKKTNQIRKSFLLFSLIHKLYLEYPDYLRNYYSYFIRRYILREKVNKKQYELEDKELDLNSYGNYIFIIATNNTLKNFKETEYLVENISYDKDCPRELVKKCFEKEDDPIEDIEKGINCIEDKPKNLIKPIILKTCDVDKNEKYKEKHQKVSNDSLLCNAYKDLNYLVENINKENDCALKVIYLDSYLNMTTPKCEIMKELQKISRTQKALIKIFETKFPELKLSELVDNDKSDE